MYKKLKKLKKHHQFIYSFLIAIAVIAMWRGIWMLMDLYFLPKQEGISAIVSILIGAVILWITHHKLS